MSNSATPELFFLTGPTGVGKTALALAWAEDHQAEILSCDSLCVYRGLDIGSAKPQAVDRARVPHHGIDLVSPDTQYSVAEFQAYSHQIVEEVSSRRRNLLVTGGSGFYLSSFFRPVVDNLAIPAEIRRRVEERQASEGMAGLIQWLRELNPDNLAGIDLANPRRVVRALERCLVSGKTVAELQADFLRLPIPFPEYRKQVVVLERSTVDLRQRIAFRVEQMLQDGLIEEVRRLQEQGIERNPSAAGAIGYRETLAYLRGDVQQHELAETIVRNTWQLARKQRTWFRTQLPPHRTVAAATADPRTLFDG